MNKSGKVKFLTWLLILPVIYCAAEFLIYEFSGRARSIFEPTGCGGNIWRLGYWSLAAVIIVLTLQLIVGLTQVLKNKKGGMFCYILFYAVLFLMVMVQATWYPGVWLRYIPMTLVMLISGYQSKLAVEYCKASK